MTTTTTTTPPQSPQLIADVPCLHCRYNLRGLDPQGQRPECGHLVHVSILAWDEDRRRVPSILESDPRWIRALAEGLLVAVIVFVLMLALAWAPAFMFEWKTTPRKWTLGIACTMWVLSWAAAWKLSTPEEQPVEPRDRRLRRTLRVTATMYLASPFIAGLAPHYNAGWEFIVPLLLCVFAGIVATAAWFMQVGRLAARCGSIVAPIEARLLLAIFAMGFLLALMPELDGAEDSLSGMFSLFLCQFGCTTWAHRLRLFVYNRQIPHFIQLTGVILPLWSAVLTVRLLIVLRRAASRAQSSKIA